MSFSHTMLAALDARIKAEDERRLGALRKGLTVAAKEWERRLNRTAKARSGWYNGRIRQN